MAIQYEGKKPLLGVSEVTIKNEVFDHLNYKEFTIDELEKHIVGQD